MDWFKLPKKVSKTSDAEKHVRTEGLWIKCEGCRQIIWRKDLEDVLQVCPKCDYHFKIDAKTRLKYLLDRAKWVEHDAGMVSTDPLEFSDSKKYRDRLASTQKATHMKDALVSVTGELLGRKVNVCAVELKFIGGSMGAVMGEKITRAIERSLRDRVPLIIVSASGGARMQEGAVSLMQLAKIQLGADEARRSPRAVHQRADRSHHRRRHGQLRDARRPEHRANPAR